MRWSWCFCYAFLTIGSFYLYLGTGSNLLNANSVHGTTVCLAPSGKCRMESRRAKNPIMLLLLLPDGRLCKFLAFRSATPPLFNIPANTIAHFRFENHSHVLLYSMTVKFYSYYFINVKRGYIDLLISS